MRGADAIDPTREILIERRAFGGTLAGKATILKPIGETLDDLCRSGFMYDQFKQWMWERLLLGEAFDYVREGTRVVRYKLASQLDVENLAKSGTLQQAREASTSTQTRRRRATGTVYVVVGGRKTLDGMPRQNIVMGEALLARNEKEFPESVVEVLVKALADSGVLKTKQDPLRVFKNCIKTYEAAKFLEVRKADKEDDDEDEDTPE